MKRQVFCDKPVNFDFEEREKTLTEWTKEIYENAKEHGWYDEPVELPEAIALIHSELSEALAEYRMKRPDIYYECKGSGEPCSKDRGLMCADDDICQEKGLKGDAPEGVAIELADAIMRILSYCGYAGIDIEKAISIKHKYNRKRPYRHGGKMI